MLPIRRGLALLGLACLAGPATSLAVTVDAFGPSGEGGSLNGQSFEIGTGGSVFEIDAFLHIRDQDLNGPAAGSAAQLSIDALPAGLDLFVSSFLTDSDTDITLRFALENNTDADIWSLTFISFLDAEIDASSNGFFNEVASFDGILAPGQRFEADEPDLISGDIYKHAREGRLDNHSAFPPEDDVAMALSFARHLLRVGETIVFEIMISEDGDRISPGTFALTQSDLVTSTRITYSGQGPTLTPEPNSALLLALGLLGLSALSARHHERRGPSHK